LALHRQPHVSAGKRAATMASKPKRSDVHFALHIRYSAARRIYRRECRNSRPLAQGRLTGTALAISIARIGLTMRTRCTDPLLIDCLQTSFQYARRIPRVLKWSLAVRAGAKEIPPFQKSDW